MENERKAKNLENGAKLPNNTRQENVKQSNSNKAPASNMFPHKWNEFNDSSAMDNKDNSRKSRQRAIIESYLKRIPNLLCFCRNCYHL